MTEAQRAAASANLAKARAAKKPATYKNKKTKKNFIEGQYEDIDDD